MISFDVFELSLQLQVLCLVHDTASVNTLCEDLARSPGLIKNDMFCQAVQIFLLWKVLQRS